MVEELIAQRQFGTLVNMTLMMNIHGLIDLLYFKE